MEKHTALLPGRLQHGRDEVNGGYFLLSHEGKPYWERQLGPNMDCVIITEWDSVPRALCSGHGFVMGLHGDTVMHLGEEEVPHGQELRVADFIPESPGREMAIRHRGHNKSIIVVGQDGRVIYRYAINSSPNNTGMTEIYWEGPGKTGYSSLADHRSRIFVSSLTCIRQGSTIPGSWIRRAASGFIAGSATVCDPFPPPPERAAAIPSLLDR